MELLWLNISPSISCIFVEMLVNIQLKLDPEKSEDSLLFGSCLQLWLLHCGYTTFVLLTVTNKEKLS